MLFLGVQAILFFFYRLSNDLLKAATLTTARNYLYRGSLVDFFASAGLSLRGSFVCFGQVAE